MHSYSAHAPTREQSKVQTMLVMMMPAAKEVLPVEAVPMAAARVHEDHVVSSALHEHHAALHSIKICADLAQCAIGA